MNKKGFTLIELLVVIAIIGILASVVLASLNTARAKGANAAVKANLSGMRAQAELIYDDTSSYATVCTNATIVNAINAAKSAAGITTATVTALATTGGAGTATCHADGSTGWAIEVPLKDPSTSFFCVNNAGVGTTTTAFTLGASETDCQ